MKKKTLGRIAALSIAAVTAVPTFSIVASADVTVNNNVTVGNLWAVPVYSGTSIVGYNYYDTKSHAEANANPNPTTGAVDAAISVQPSVLFTSIGQKFDINAVTGQITLSSTGAYTYNGTGSSGGTTTVAPGSFGTLASGTSYLAGGRWYPNLQAVHAALGPNATYTAHTPFPAYSVSTGFIYFNTNDGNYTNNPSGGTIEMTGTTSNYYYNQYYVPSGYRYASNTTYYSPETHTYYPNLEALRAAVGYNTTNYTTSTPAAGYSYSSTNHYFDPTNGNYYSTSGGNRVSVTSGTATNYYGYYSTVTGKYYDTYAAALSASGGDTSKVIYGYGYNGMYDYTNPYYYYYGLGGYGWTTTTKDTSKVTIGNLRGWTAVTRTINSAKTGASYTVNMKTETEIPESVLKALKGKNIDISFKFSNGAVITINGTDITSTSAISPTVKYGSTSIPSSLKKKAVKANSGVSSSQFTINGGSFGVSASVTVKFNSKRAGCSAKLYRYNSSDNTLSLISRSAVQSNGQCAFDNVKQGGEYIVVLS